MHANIQMEKNKQIKKQSLGQVLFIIQKKATNKQGIQGKLINL